MNYQNILSFIVPIAISFCVLSTIIARHKGPNGHKLCAVGALTAIVANALELYYGFDIANILIIFLAGIILYLAGLNAGKAEKRDKTTQNP